MSLSGTTSIGTFLGISRMSLTSPERADRDGFLALSDGDKIEALWHLIAELRREIEEVRRCAIGGI